MTKQHLITPPPELIKDWHDEWNESDQIVHSAYTHIAIRAAQWGSDQELEACIDWMKQMGYWGEDGNAIPALRAARRSKPPSLKEQAIAVLEDAQLDAAHYNILRRALEQLDD